MCDILSVNYLLKEKRERVWRVYYLLGCADRKLGHVNSNSNGLARSQRLSCILTNARLTIIYRKKEVTTLIFTARRNICLSSPSGPARTSVKT
jgi:hypothetical protein